MARSAKQTRHIPNAIKREFYERDPGQCTVVAPDGQSWLERYDVKP